MHGNKYYFGAAKYIPLIMRPVMNWVGKRPANKPIPKKISQLPDVDHRLMNEPEKMKQLSRVTLHEACKFGSKGLVHEAALYFKPLGYTLSQIVQPVHFWWGFEDNVVTRVHAEAVEKQVPQNIMHYKKNEGHLSIYINCIEEVLNTIESFRD